MTMSTETPYLHRTTTGEDEGSTKLSSRRSRSRQARDRRDARNRLFNLIAVGLTGGITLGAAATFFNKKKKLEEEEDKEDLFKDPQKFFIRPAKANPSSSQNKLSHEKNAAPAASVVLPVMAGLATLGTSYALFKKKMQKIERRELKDRLRRAQRAFAHSAYGVEPPKPKDEDTVIDIPSVPDNSSGEVPLDKNAGTRGLSAMELAKAIAIGSPIALFAAAMMASRGTLNQQFPKAEIRRPETFGNQFRPQDPTKEDADDKESEKSRKPSEMWYSGLVPSIPGFTHKSSHNTSEAKLAVRNSKNGLHEFWINVIGSHSPLFEKSGYADVVTAALIPGGIVAMEKAAMDLGKEGVFSVAKELRQSNSSVKLSSTNFRPAVTRVVNSGAVGGVLFPNTVAEAMHMSPTVSSMVMNQDLDDPEVQELQKMGFALAQMERERSLKEWTKIAESNAEAVESFSGTTLDEFMDEVLPSLK